MGFKLTTTAGALRGLLTSASAAIRRNSTLPIVNNVKIVGKDGKVSMTGTNLEVEITATQAIGDFSGTLSTTLEARKLQSILDTIESSEVLTLALTPSGKIQLTGASGRFSFSTLPAEDFPEVIRSSNFKAKVTTTQSKLKALFERIGFAMADHDVRYFLNGMSLSIKGDRLTGVATNGHHLATDTIILESAVAEPVKLILPRTTVLDIKRQIDTSDDAITLEFDSSQLRATFGNVEYVSKLIEGEFPDWRRIACPSLEVGGAEFRRVALLVAGQRARALVMDKLFGVTLTLTADLGGGKVRIEGRNSLNESDEEVPAVYDGPTATMGFNVVYLFDALSAFDMDSLCLRLPPVEGAALITATDRPDFRYIIMPMRV